MTVDLPRHNHLAGDLARCKTLESNNDWPTAIEIRAKWKTAKGGFRFKTITISGEQFFGTGGGFNAPLTGDQVIGMVDKLRRQG